MIGRQENCDYLLWVLTHTCATYIILDILDLLGSMAKEAFYTLEKGVDGGPFDRSGL
jgi:hypothetical protein